MRSRLFIVLMVVALAGAVLAAAQASVVGARVSAAQATKCLKAHRALVQANPAIRELPHAPAISVSFALVPGQRQDQLFVSFASSHSAAATAAAQVVKRLESKVPTIRRYLTVKNNALVYWQSPHPTAATRAAVLGCLRSA